MLESFTCFLKVLRKLPHFYRYEPGTVMLELDSTPYEISQAFMCQAVFHTVRVFEEFDLFQNVVLSFNGRAPDFDFNQDVAPAEICWALYIIRKCLDNEYKLDESVMAYIAAELQQDGFINVPNALSAERTFTDLPIQFFLDKITAVKVHPNKEAENQEHSKNETIKSYIKSRENKLQAEIAALKTEGGSN